MTTEDLDVDLTDETTTTPPAPRIVSRPSRLLIALLVGAVIIGGWGLWVRHDTHRAEALTAETQRHVAATVADISEVTASLRGDIAHLSAQQSQSQTEQAQLTSDRSALSKAQATLFYEGIDVTQLNTCLSGVVKALNALSLNDVADATTALQSVLASCKAANG
jgi:hypothetical protein